MTEQAVPVPELSARPSLVGRALDLYVGGWGGQLVIYGVTLLIALAVALWADLGLGMSPERIVPLVITLTVTLLVIVPLGYVIVAQSLSSNTLHGVEKAEAGVRYSLISAFTGVLLVGQILNFGIIVSILVGEHGDDFALTNRLAYLLGIYLILSLVELILNALLRVKSVRISLHKEKRATDRRTK